MMRQLRVDMGLSRGVLAACFAILLLTVLVYGPGLSGSFMFDDHWNIVQNRALQLNSLNPESLREAASSGTAGPLKRPVAMLSFALNHYVSDFDAPAFKRTNLLLHLLNGVLVYAVILQLMRTPRLCAGEHHNPDRAEWVAFLAAGLWLLHPLNMGAVLYVVQRMTLLASLFTLMALFLYLLGRRNMDRGRSYAMYWLTAVLLCMPLAALSKEIGLLIPLYLMVVELTLFSREGLGSGSRRFLYFFHGLFCIAPIVMALLYVVLSPEVVTAGYVRRHFDLGERVLTESRALWFYLRLIIIPDVSSLGLFHDDFVVSRGVLSPWTTLLSLLAWAAVTGIALIHRLRYPLLVFGLFFFLVGHGMESTIFSLELVHEHRNYLPQLGILAVLSWCLLGCTQTPARVGAAVAVLCLAWFAFSTGLRALAWADPGTFSITQYQNHPQSARSNYELGRLYARQVASSANDDEARERYFAEAEKFLVRAGELQPHFSEGLFGLVILYSTNDLEIPSGVIDELARRLHEESFPVNNVNQFNALVLCWSERHCSIDALTLNRLLSSARSNPRVDRPLAVMIPAGVQRSER